MQRMEERERAREETMNGGVICNGISWQQWRIVWQNGRIVVCWRTLSPDVAFPAQPGTSSSRQKTACQPVWFRAFGMYATRTAATAALPHIALCYQKADHSNSQLSSCCYTTNRNAAAPTACLKRKRRPTPRHSLRVSRQSSISRGRSWHRAWSHQHLRQIKFC